MSAVSSLVPARFLTLTAHLVIVITIFWSRENNVEACLPLDFTQDQYDKEDTKLVVALSVTMGLFAIELAGFFSGVSMFNCTQGLLCILYMFSKLFHKTLYIFKVHIMHSTAVVTSPSPGELQFAFVLAQY
uniref:Transmembrane protein 107 n=1 Tax=Oncorhynchus mykiss TaxID=8022 RepID=A0A8K9URH5_ONCMY